MSVSKMELTKLVISHQCLSTRCCMRGCELCRSDPRYKCGHLHTKSMYAKGSSLVARCGAPLFVQLQPQPAADEWVECCLLDAGKYKQQLQAKSPVPLDNTDLDKCKVATSTVVTWDKPTQLQGRCFLKLVNGKAHLHNISFGTSIYSKQQLQLLFQAVQPDPNAAANSSIAYAVSEPFVLSPATNKPAKEDTVPQLDAPAVTLVNVAEGRCSALATFFKVPKPKADNMTVRDLQQLLTEDTPQQRGHIFKQFSNVQGLGMTRADFDKMWDHTWSAHTPGTKQCTWVCPSADIALLYAVNHQGDKSTPIVMQTEAGRVTNKTLQLPSAQLQSLCNSAAQDWEQRPEGCDAGHQNWQAADDILLQPLMPGQPGIAACAPSVQPHLLPQPHPGLLPPAQLQQALQMLLGSPSLLATNSRSSGLLPQLGTYLLPTPTSDTQHIPLPDPFNPDVKPDAQPVAGPQANALASLAALLASNAGAPAGPYVQPATTIALPQMGGPVAPSLTFPGIAMHASSSSGWPSMPAQATTVTMGGLEGTERRVPKRSRTDSNSLTTGLQAGALWSHHEGAVGHAGPLQAQPSVLMPASANNHTTITAVQPTAPQSMLAGQHDRRHDMPSGQQDLTTGGLLPFWDVDMLGTVQLPEPALPSPGPHAMHEQGNIAMGEQAMDEDVELNAFLQSLFPTDESQGSPQLGSQGLQP